MKLLPGRIAVEYPQRVEKLKSGIYIDTSFPAGAEYNYAAECRKVQLAVLRSPEAAYMKKWGQLGKLRKLVEREVARVPRKQSEAQIGHARYNNVFAKVLASGCDGIEAGDTIYFNYRALDVAKENTGIFPADEYFPVDWTILKYGSCYFVVKGGTFKPDTVKMLNGNVLVRPIPLPTIEFAGMQTGVTNSGILYVKKESTFEQQIGVLAFAPEGFGIPVGSTVVIDKDCDIPLEYEMIRSLPEVYFCMKDYEVLGTYDNEVSFTPAHSFELQNA